MSRRPDHRTREQSITESRAIEALSRVRNPAAARACDRLVSRLPTMGYTRLAPWRGSLRLGASRRAPRRRLGPAPSSAHDRATAAVPPPSCDLGRRRDPCRAARKLLQEARVAAPPAWERALVGRVRVPEQHRETA